MFEVTAANVRPWVTGDATDDLLVLAISRAERLLVAKLPTLAARADADPDLFALVRDQIVAVVARFANNPRGIRQEMEGGYSIMLDSAVSSGLLGFTDAELALLAPKVDVAYGKPFRQHIPCYRVI